MLGEVVSFLGKLGVEFFWASLKFLEKNISSFFGKFGAEIFES